LSPKNKSSDPIFVTIVVASEVYPVTCRPANKVGSPETPSGVAEPRDSWNYSSVG